MSINFTTAKNLVEIKMQRNDTLIELLNVESEILKKGILINYRHVENNKGKVELIKKINDIEAQQMEVYCPLRQELVKDLTDQVNNNSMDLKDLYGTVVELKNKCSELLLQIRDLNSQIPSQTVVTNYKIPMKVDNCHGFSSN